MRRAQAPRRLLCVVDLVQDCDAILPVAIAARSRMRVDVLMTDWLQRIAPAVPAKLAKYGFEPAQCSRQELGSGPAPDFSGVDALFTASDSTAAPHRFVHAAVKRANAAGVPTLTLQHGLENVGLTSNIDGTHEIASSRILLWNTPDRLPAWVPFDLRSRCVGVGRPTMPSESPGESPFAAGGVIAVFENLHWDRFDDGYVQHFLSDLGDAARLNPEQQFVIKPHPAGRWLVNNPDALDRSAKNLAVADPTNAEWASVTASQLIRASRMVITTPSTVALDAALLGVPAAVAAYGLDLPMYEPLPLLRRTSDWMDFISVESNGHRDLEIFAARHVLQGDAASRSVDVIEQALGARR